MAFSFSYEYDAAGNRVKKTDDLTGSVTLYTFNSGNQVQLQSSPAGNTSFAYDRSGNLQTVQAPPSQVTTYAWNAESRRVSTTTASGVVLAVYDADGRRK